MKLTVLFIFTLKNIWKGKRKNTINCTCPKHPAIAGILSIYLDIVSFTPSKYY